ncbi:unnamed protein product [Dibothriocephalus latus]|uniref:Uncharacterized protein n=1 Tax=Dibothriocephalus latus TaxID=60516 RepID=A0A3P7LHN7_DIBLA|nr:unnamed protein product [Dibothriocephalus latus]
MPDRQASNGLVGSPPEKLPCFRTVLPPLPPKSGEDCEDFIDAGINEVDDDSEESGSRYFDQHGVLVSKL